ncbi:MAG: HEPN domain-containing protein [Deltaproteobacteria bacterium]|nr:HEPN domain-containing protein [Deltaproteobacteria bacterium]
MHNRGLSIDYITRARHRLSSLEVLLTLGDFADVVREAQEVVELALKALLRHSGIEVPRVHDVSSILIDNAALLPAGIQNKITQLTKISRTLRRDRELAFYGSEDLTPSEFYKQEDADAAKNQATWVVTEVEAAMVDATALRR